MKNLTPHQHAVMAATKEFKPSHMGRNRRQMFGNDTVGNADFVSPEHWAQAQDELQGMGLLNHSNALTREGKARLAASPGNQINPAVTRLKGGAKMEAMSSLRGAISAFRSAQLYVETFDPNKTIRHGAVFKLTEPFKEPTGVSGKPLTGASGKPLTGVRAPAPVPPPLAPPPPSRR